jgi:predicted RNA-binding protein YlxR (DUF448 family)
MFMIIYAVWSFKVFSAKRELSRECLRLKTTNQGRLQSSKGMVERGSYMVGSMECCWWKA